MRNDLIRSLYLIGAGKMGSALLSGWLRNGLAAAEVTVIDPSPPLEAQQLIADHKIRHFVEVPKEAKATFLILAVKPQILVGLLPSLRSICDPNTIVVSIAAGTTLKSMIDGLGHQRIIRTIPNTPAQVGRGVTVAVSAGNISETERADVAGLLSAVGEVGWVAQEALIDVITAISGSGPAYLFYLVEVMTAAGIKNGLTPDLAEMLARQTVSGAGELLYQSDEKAEILRQNVTSPNGTTLAGLNVLMADGGLKDLMQRTIDAAAERSRELGKE